MPKVEAKAKVEAKPIVEVKPKSVLKPTRKINVDEYVRHCTKGSPDQRGLPSPSESIANSTMSRYPLSEWDMDRLPIDMPDRFKKLAFKRQESKETSDLEAQPTKVVSLPFFPSLFIPPPPLFLTDFCDPDFPRQPGKGLVDCHRPGSYQKPRRRSLPTQIKGLAAADFTLVTGAMFLPFTYKNTLFFACISPTVFTYSVF